MTTADRSVRATSFGAIAADYDRYRPGPPAAGVDWVLGARRDLVVDIGAGTGALARLLVERATQVIAVEPDRRMSAVLSGNVPNATVTTARAEQLPLRAGSVDAVMGSSMWHWVDEPRAVMEAARVLRPGGVLGVMWGGPDRSQGWLADVLSGPARAWRDREEESHPERHHRELHIPESAPFEPAERHFLEWSIAITRDELVGLTRTYSGFIVLADAEQARIHALVADAVREHPSFADRDRVDLPMRCVCWRTVRRA
jgi:SAM-dependent methyltransferase